MSRERAQYTDKPTTSLEYLLSTFAYSLSVNVSTDNEATKHSRTRRDDCLGATGSTRDLGACPRSRLSPGIHIRDVTSRSDLKGTGILQLQQLTATHHSPHQTTSPPLSRSWPAYARRSSVKSSPGSLIFLRLSPGPQRKKKWSFFFLRAELLFRSLKFVGEGRVCATPRGD